jgi:TRAP transporter TAXI family solute receptor
MKTRFIHLLLVLSGFLTIPYATAEEIGMVTGSPTGTYIKFGYDIAAVAQKAGLNIQVKESQGSIDNINRMDSSENAAFGIVQSDVLGFLARSDKANLKAVAGKLRLVFPLYHEEVHLFARKDINRFEDLEGQRLILGVKGSGNWLTAMNLLQLLNVKPREYVEDLPPPKAITAVLTGKADAMIYVAGKPVELFTNLDKLKSDPEYASLVEQVHFVRLDDPRLLKEYLPAAIAAGDYGWSGNDTPTIAVKALLVSFDFSGKQTPYYRQRCQELATLGRALRDNIDTLKQTGHPKWQQVKLEDNVGIWKLDACSRQSDKIGQGGKPATNRDIGRELEDILSKPAPRR